MQGKLILRNLQAYSYLKEKKKKEIKKYGKERKGRKCEAAAKEVGRKGIKYRNEKEGKDIRE